MKIYKYEFPITDEFSLELPDGARILTAFVQKENKEHSVNRKVCLWAEVNPEAPNRTYKFAVIGTGNPMPEGLSSFGYTGYIATFTDGPFVWHLYKK